jgi:hypothetical protein
MSTSFQLEGKRRPGDRSSSAQLKVGSKGWVRSLSRRSLGTKIPKEICDQEAEIESMFLNLVLFDDKAGLHHKQRLAEDRPDKEVDAWILISLLCLASIFAFCLLWLKASHG